jgi:hypothetical protein
MPDDATPAAKRCPICGRPQDARVRPFCSRRCADVDLHRWLSGAYVAPGLDDETDEASSPRLAPEGD